jgi:putative phosphoesterase
MAEPTPYGIFASQVLRQLLQELQAQLEGAVEAEDVEYVHRSRVASRRVRAALVLFEECFPKKRYKAWSKGVKRITRSFGKARDLDVQMMFLEEFIENNPRTASLSVLLDDLMAQRKEVQSDVTKAVERFHSDDLAAQVMTGLMSGEIGPEDWREIRVAALAHVMDCIQEIMALEKFVPLPEEKLRHHQMRIAGKRLRYTLEIFSPAFGDALRPSIKKMKELQDLLGEMHDCDVWEEVLAGKGEKSREVKALLEDRHLRRIELHGQFVAMWNEMRQVHLYEMERTLRQGIKGQVEREAPDRHVGLISDVHGNLPALKAVLMDAREQGVDLFLNAGDSVGLGPYTMGVVEALQADTIRSVRGNVDINVLKLFKDPSLAQGKKDLKTKIALLAANNLDRKSADVLERFPLQIRIKTGKKDILVTHGSPASVEEKVDELTEVDRMEELAALAKCDMVVFGHTHQAFDREVKSVRFVNPGSVGRQSDGDPRASYAIWDTEKGTVEQRHIPYRLHELLEEADRKEWPLEFVKTFVSGRTVEFKETEAKAFERNACLASCETVTTRYGQWDEHPRFVREGCRNLFKELAPIHKLNDRDLLLLECAATMHDVGWYWGGKDHHKSSFDLIALASEIPLSGQDRLKVAVMARYHRGSLPRQEHGWSGLMGKRDRERLYRSIALLRIADGLDYGHAQRAVVASVKISKDRVCICLERSEGCQAEIAACLRKANMFQQLFGKQLEIA